MEIPPRQRPSFSSKECHVGIVKHEEQGIQNFVEPTTEASIKKILEAVDLAIQSAYKKRSSYSVILTFCWYRCVGYDDYIKICDLMDHHRLVKSFDESDKKTLRATLINEYEVTVNFHGESVFSEAILDDSFESVESLTQRVNNIQLKSPQIKTKTIGRAHGGRK